MFDPTTLPLPDLGLRCKGCGYPLANASRWACPECGRAFTLEEYIPRGDCPVLIAGGEQVRGTEEVRALLERYRIPAVEVGDLVKGLFGGVNLLPRFGRAPAAPVIGVPRARYFEAVDLIRRLRLREPMPPTPDAPTDGPDWPCEACGESNPSSFEVCWQCETARAV